MRHRKSVGEYLAYLSVKYEIEPEKFLSALRQAGVGKKTECGKFSVECLGRTEGKQIFLVRNGSRVVAQFRVPDEFFLESGDSFGTRAMGRVSSYSAEEKNVHHYVENFWWGLRICRGFISNSFDVKAHLFWRS